ncbi:MULTISPECIES: AglZ/HisF2 family acetamidino modification protein [Flavobacterium]|uniref:AglZ/HisF2 family acetamidino modification protein n=1 Tax=Flavobacterium TaxID=237 RepID=UPI0011826FCA|nr:MULTISPECIES: AglZ/HisF2 family acetamidino modification protein [Flavobacterium]MCR4030922.1 AglZ/HisF2 family acetamidino modification protein [Flavobacterium panacis]
MLRSRITPCLLVHNKGLVKTTNFKDPKYVGDPLNAVKIFNEKEVDELIVLDIDATIEGRGPDFELIQNLAIECRMPFCYGGGVTTVEQAKKIISLGAEKVALSAAAIYDTEILKKIANAVGSQSVVVVIDVKKKKLFGGYEIVTHNGKKTASVKLADFLETLNQIGIGELVVNSVDNDGKMQGLDFKLFDFVRDQTEMPMTILGGVGTLEHIKEAISRYKTIGVSAGSFFVFKGKYRAVLISYPKFEERKLLYQL